MTDQPNDYLKCESFKVISFQIDADGPVFELVASSKGKEYRLQAESPDENKNVVRDLLKRLGKLWPDCGFEFKANAKREITVIRK